MIPFDHRQRTSIFQERAELFKRTPRFCQMLQHEADKDMIEAALFEREPEDISLPERDIPDPFLTDPFFSTLKGIVGDIDRCDQGAGTVAGKDHGLSTDPAAGLQHP
jgi:hypothetical protein